MPECPDCGRVFSSRLCPGCGYRHQNAVGSGRTARAFTYTRDPLGPPPGTRYPGMAKASMRTIQDTLDGRISVPDLIQWCSDADARWPGVGWGKTSADLGAHRSAQREKGFLHFRGHWRSPASLPVHERERRLVGLEDEAGADYGDIVIQERCVMTESNWRARWDLAKIDLYYKPLADAIPERLRIQFAVEDQIAEETQADREKGAETEPKPLGKAVPF